MKKRLMLIGALTLVGGLAMGATQLGNMLKLDKHAAIATCNAVSEGSMARMFGGVSETDTKLCFCKSDGAASPAYQWCSLTLTGGSNVVCAGGSTTVCP